MRIPQAQPIVQDDIDLDIEIITCMICMYTCDLSDTPREAHSDVEEDVALIGGGGGSSEVLDVPCRYARPGDYNVDG